MTWDTFHPFKDHDRMVAVVNRCLEAASPILDKFTTIVVRGASGATVGAIVAYHLNKSLAVVRKPRESVHLGNYIAGTANPNTSLFLDDFVENGGTLQAVSETIGGVPRFVLLYSNRPWGQGSADPESFRLGPLGDHLWERRL